MCRRRGFPGNKKKQYQKNIIWKPGRQLPNYHSFISAHLQTLKSWQLIPHQKWPSCFVRCGLLQWKASPKTAEIPCLHHLERDTRRTVMSSSVVNERTRLVPLKDWEIYWAGKFHRLQPTLSYFGKHIIVLIKWISSLQNLSSGHFYVSSNGALDYFVSGCL